MSGLMPPYPPPPYGTVSTINSPGSILTYGAGGGGGTAYYASNNTTATIQDRTSLFITSDDIVLRRPDKPDLNVGTAIEQILERLVILQADMEKMEKYPALKEAYESYKLLEAMIGKYE